MKKIIRIIMVLAFSLPLVSSAATIKTGNDYFLAKTDTINDNLYVGGGNATIAGTVQGDIVTAGGMIQISGTTAQDVLSAGGNISISGNVGGDVRVAGGTILVTGQVAGDAVLGGGQVQIGPDAMVGHDAILGGGSITMLGHVRGRVEATGGQVTINGPVDGDLKVHAGTVTLGEHAVINGNFSYQSPQQVTIEPGAVVHGKTTYEPVEKRSGETSGRFLSLIGKIIVLFVTLWILSLIFGRWSVLGTSLAFGSFWWNVLRGLVALIVIPIISLILLITIVGIPLGAIGLLLYTLLLILSCLAAPIIAGSLIFAWRGGHIHDDLISVNWKTILVGVLVLVILSYIPIIGPLIWFVFMLAGFGTLINVGYGKMKRSQRGDTLDV